MSIVLFKNIELFYFFLEFFLDLGNSFAIQGNFFSFPRADLLGLAFFMCLFPYPLTVFLNYIGVVLMFLPKM